MSKIMSKCHADITLKYYLSVCNIIEDEVGQ